MLTKTRVENLVIDELRVELQYNWVLICIALYVLKCLSKKLML